MLVASIDRYFGDPRALVQKFIGRGVNLPEPKLKNRPDPHFYTKAWRANNVAKGLTQAWQAEKAKLDSPRQAKHHEPPRLFQNLV